MGGAGGVFDVPNPDVGTGDRVWSNGGSSSSRDRGAFSIGVLETEPFLERTGVAELVTGKSDAEGSTTEGTDTTEPLVGSAVVMLEGSAVVMLELAPPQLVQGAATGADLVKIGR